MNSSVTISNDLRKKIKMLAAKLDSTQGDIVEKAIEMFENSLEEKESYKVPKIRKKMKETIDNNPNLEWRKKIREKLREPGIELEEFKIEIKDDL